MTESGYSYKVSSLVGGWPSAGGISRDGEHYVHRVYSSLRAASKPVVGFVSLKPRENLIDGVISLLEKLPEINTQSIDRMRHLPRAKLSWSSFSLATERFLDKLDGAPEEQALQFLIWSTGGVTSAAKIRKLSTNHLKYWSSRDLESHGDIFRYFQPLISSWEDDLCVSFFVQEAWFPWPASLLKRLDDEETRQFFNKIVRIKYMDSTGPDWESRLRDIPTAGSVKPGWNIDFCTLPFHHAEFREFLLGLKVREFSLLVNNIPLRTPPKVAVEMAKGLISSQEVEGTVTLAIECYETLSSASEHVEDIEYWIKIYTTILANWHNGSLINLLTQYFQGKEPASVSARNVKQVVDSMFGPRLKWVKTKNHAGNIAASLLKLTNSAERTMEIIQGVEESEVNPSLENWNTYFENWEEHLETPPGLVMELL